MFGNNFDRGDPCPAQRGNGLCGNGYSPCFPGTPCRPGGSSGTVGPTGPAGPPGPTGPAAATIPFGVSQFGIQLATDAEGNPQAVFFTGYGPEEEDGAILLLPGEWATGRVTIRQDMNYGTSFVMPYDAILRNIFVLFSSKYGMDLEPGVIVYPFACVAVSAPGSNNLVYTILQDSITYTEPYVGGIQYPKHTLRRGSVTGLNLAISEGSLVAVITGIRAENVTEEQFAAFSISGGIFLE